MDYLWCISTVLDNRTVEPWFEWFQDGLWLLFFVWIADLTNYTDFPENILYLSSLIKYSILHTVFGDKLERIDEHSETYSPLSSNAVQPLIHEQRGWACARCTSSILAVVCELGEHYNRLCLNYVKGLSVGRLSPSLATTTLLTSCQSPDPYRRL